MALPPFLMVIICNKHFVGQLKYYTIQINLNHVWTRLKVAYAAFIDLEKAYDS